MAKKKVLIADDELSIRQLVKSILKGNYTVLEAGDGEAAIKAAHSQKPDLILMDILMPKKDGFEACFELKSSSATKATPVIMLTAIDYDLDRKLGERLGADGYITKPFSPHNLPATIDSILANAM